MTDVLFSPHRLGRITLRNRVVMSPMTRSRAIDHLPNDTMVTYYRQRSGAGLIVTEGTSPSPDGLGYARIPGLYDGRHVSAWRRVTDAVHEAGSSIFVQLMHTGRVGHPLNLPAGARVRGPSAKPAPGEMYTDQAGPQPHPVPEVMTEVDVERALEEFATASRLAVEAGFDGVELHGANGYLIEQFLNVASNDRADRWGGTVENRARFALEAARRAAEAIGPDRVGIRLSPHGAFGGMVSDPETDDLHVHLAEELGRIGLIYLHLVDHSSMGAPPLPPALKATIRAKFPGTLILSGGYDRARAESDLVAKKGDLVAFGRPFIANPDLVERMRGGLELAPPDPKTFYTPGEVGYTDYPTAREHAV